MNDDNPAPRKRRQRFFGRNPHRRHVFSLDTSNQDVPQHLLRKLPCIAASVSPASVMESCVSGTHDSSTNVSNLSSKDGGLAEGITDQLVAGDSTESVTQHEVLCSAGSECQQTDLRWCGDRGDSPRVGDAPSSHEGGCAGTAATRRGLLVQGRAAGACLKSTLRNPVTRPIEAESHFRAGSFQEDKTATETPYVSLMSTQGQDNPACGADRHKEEEDAVMPLGTSATVAEGQCSTGRAGDMIGDANRNGPERESSAVSAASMIASFLKQGAAPILPAGVSTPSPAGQRFHLFSRSSSPTTTPLPLASLVAGISARNHSGGTVEDSCITDVVVPSPRGTAGGVSCFLNNEWPPALKERRRIVRFPKRSEPAGTRILYWVRGNYRVRDNLALSVAMWLSTELRMPLQAVTFVDPAIGCLAPAGRSGTQERTPGGGVQGNGNEKQLPFRTGVEASALCEMEQALQALNISLIAIACTQSEVPEYLAGWCSCSAGVDNKSETATSTSPAAAAAAAAVTLPEGRVHIAITDESYHPRQLWLTEKAGQRLPGVALYAVDSSCVCSVNNFKETKPAAATDASEPAVSLQDEFRKAQDAVLRTACTELMPRPRLPLQMQLQAPVFGVRGSLPRDLEDILRSAMTSSVAVVDWRLLRQHSARRFRGAQEAFAPRFTSSRQDLIAMFGGGERVGEAVLHQTLDIAIGTPVDQPLESSGVDDRRTGGDDRVSEGNCDNILEHEVSGTGFGGALLHLLRLGSISSLYAVHAVFDRMQAVGEGGRQGSSTNSKVQGLMRLLDAVLSREYALYRSLSYYQREGRRCAGDSEVATAAVSYAKSVTHVVKERVWRPKDWMGIVPEWVWEQLQKGQRDARQYQHSPREIKSAGSTVPSSVQDPLFSAIQVRVTNGARLQPMLAPYWARSVVTMMLVPSQAISLLIGMVEELCLGAAYAGDVVPDLLANAFDAFKDTPSIPSDPTAVAQPIFRKLSRPPLASLAGLQSAFGGERALGRFVLSLPLSPSSPASR